MSFRQGINSLLYNRVMDSDVGAKMLKAELIGKVHVRLSWSWSTYSTSVRSSRRRFKAMLKLAFEHCCQIQHPTVTFSIKCTRSF